MTEYMGPLIGGPNDGNVFTVSVDRIPVISTAELWLDGKDKDSTVIEMNGYYMWLANDQCFMWSDVETKVYSKKFIKS